MLSDTAGSFNTISALAVDPAGTKVAAHGFVPYEISPTHATGYLIVLDAATGASVSGLFKMTHTA